MNARVVAVDWSGDRIGAKRKIWLAEAVAGKVTRLEDGRDRREIVDELVAMTRSGVDLVVGLDFAFSLPTWYVGRMGARTAPELWDRLADGRCDEILGGCPPPFWGRPGIRRPPDTPECPRFRRTEDFTSKATNAAGGRGPRIVPKSVFQIGGAGAVGTGSLRGMIELPRLRAGGFAIWPFDDPRLPLVVEIYPRVLTGPVVKSSEDARRAYLDVHGYRDRTTPDASSAAERSEDAFDACVSALVLSDDVDDVLSLPVVADERLRIEGIIWQPGWRVCHDA